MKLHANAALSFRQRDLLEVGGPLSGRGIAGLVDRSSAPTVVCEPQRRADRDGDTDADRLAAPTPRRASHLHRLGDGALRWAFIEAAHATTQSGGPVVVTFQRIAERRGCQIAKVAVARKILTLCCYGLRDGGSVASRPETGRARSW